MKKVLLVGESWEIFSIHQKGFDAFFTTKYDEGAKWLIEALEAGGYQVDYIPNHHAPSKVPTTLEELQKYSVIILSDVGANTLLLHPDTFERSIATPNRLKLFRDYVDQGGAFLMVGGYLSFTGIDGKAKYRHSPVEEILPVTLMEYDDRVEVPEGLYPTVVHAEHPVVQGLDATWPMLLGYNKLAPKAEADVLVSAEEDPILVVGSYGKGKTAAFASDCAPHWGSPEFVQWKQYNQFWQQLIHWLEY
ncbi:MAG: cytoplasmic protein [Firmicutes bacterium]|nr:cytoplasmic protein [Bacillota bacterium]